MVKKPTLGRVVLLGIDEPADDEKNENVHTPEQQLRLRASVRLYGQQESILIDAKKKIIGGHGIREAMKAEGYTHIRCEYSDLKGAKRDAYRIVTNQLARLSHFDPERLAINVADIMERGGDRFDPLWLGMSAHDVAKIRGTEDGPDAPPAQMDNADALQRKWKCRTGDLWRIGQHRLLVGDCGIAADLDRVTAGSRKLTAAVTSPPYVVGLDYEQGLTLADLLATVERLAQWMLDKFPPGGFVFWNFGDIVAQAPARKLTKEKEPCVYFTASDYWRIFRSVGWLLHAHRIWVKPYGALPMGWRTLKTTLPHHGEWEHIWTWRKPGGPIEKARAHEKSCHGVWTTAEGELIEATRDKHAAGFPVVLPRWALDVHTDKGDTILEPFNGGGSAMVACEQMGRRCYGVEKLPQIAAVCLQRMSDMGLKPEREKA
jgi:DNA modification methylase